MLAVMRELFKSIEALDTVTTFLGQPEWLRDVPWETRKKDEADLVTLLRAISTSKSGFKAVLGLRGERAQQFLDMAHEVRAFITFYLCHPLTFVRPHLDITFPFVATIRR